MLACPPAAAPCPATSPTGPRRRGRRGRRGGPGRLALLASLLLAQLAVAAGARAAGMFVTPHGARPLARGGAFVAGADDLNAIYYNPAGVAAVDYGQSGWSGLLDLSFVLQHVTYTRDENGIMRPPVSSDSSVAGGAPLFIPQIGFARKLRRDWGSMSFGFGVWIPNAGLARYPEGRYDTEEDLQRVPDVSPQRYQLIGLHEGSLARSSLLAVLNPVAAFSLLGDKLQLGLGPQLMVIYGRSRIVLSGCPQVMCRPEDPEYDVLALAQAFTITPSFNLGGIYRPLPWLRLGLGFQFPFFVRSLVGKADTRLPASPLFNGAVIKGRDAGLALTLPPILRVGAELRTLKDRLRIEVAYTAEFWAVQDRIDFTPDGITIENFKGVGTYELLPLAIERAMQNTHSLHLGLEAVLHRFVGARLGGMFETASMPDRTLTLLTPDGLKGFLGVGLFLPAVRFASTEWRFDLSYGRVIQPDRVIAARDSGIYPANPIRPTAPMPEGVGGIGGGRYEVSYDLIAVGFSAVR